MGVRAGDRKPDPGKDRLGDSLGGSGERAREGKTGRPHQHGSDGEDHDLGATGSCDRTPSAVGMLVFEVSADLLHHRDHRGTFTLGIDRGTARSRPQEHGDAGISGRGIVGLDMPREESVGGVTIEEEAPHLTPDIAPAAHSVMP
jgi:hypothetical protein